MSMRPRNAALLFCLSDLDAQRIDDGIPRHRYRLLRDSLTKESCASRLGRREVERHERRGQPAIHLLGERRPDVAGAQSGLDVADWDAPVKAGQRRGQHGRRIALHQGHVGPGRFQAAVDPSISLAVSPASVWFGRMTSRSASTAMPKVSATWRNISLCCPVATTVQRKSLVSRNAATTGASFTASGRVPMKTRMLRFVVIALSPRVSFGSVWPAVVPSGARRSPGWRTR